MLEHSVCTSLPNTMSNTKRISKIRKEYHTRKQKENDRGNIVYIVEDKLTQWCLLGQKLSGLVNAINTIVDSKPDRVSLPGLYQSSKRGAVSYTKYRWKIVPYPIDEAAAVFEDRRGRFDRVAVIGDLGCYSTVDR